MFTAVESSFRNIFNKQKAIHIRKFSWLYDQQKKASFAPTPDSKKFVLNLSKHTLTDSEEAVTVLRCGQFVVEWRCSDRLDARIVVSDDVVLSIVDTLLQNDTHGRS
jgi:hypothetical protein